MFVKNVSILVAVVLAAATISNVAAEYDVNTFAPHYMSLTLLNRFQCISDTLIEVLKEKRIDAIWPQAKLMLQDRINKWKKCLDGYNYDAARIQCNHDQGLEAFKQLVSYMDLVESTVPKLTQTFIREQNKRCSKL